MFKENQFVKKIEISAEDMRSVREVLGLLDPTPEEWVKFQYIGEGDKLSCEFPDRFVMVDEFLEGEFVTIVECYDTFNEGIV
jgi:hypothetical protein